MTDWGAAVLLKDTNVRRKMGQTEDHRHLFVKAKHSVLGPGAKRFNCCFTSGQEGFGGMTCPFKALLGKAEPLVEADNPALCPFLSKQGSSGDVAKELSKPAEAAGDLHAASDVKNSGVCPLGFGTNSGPKFSILHCTLCRSLMYDCSKLENCGHRFCRYCITKFQDCPVCGADVKGLSSDKEMQEVVDKYIEVHSASHTLWEVDTGNPQEQVDDPTGMGRSPATFYLQLGLRSYVGGNLKAAFSRLKFCYDDLTKRLGQSDEEGNIQCQAGAVCGSLGDCTRRLGDTNSAVKYYERSTSHLKAAPANSDAAKEVPVSLNKLGDLHFCLDNVAAARKLYAEALVIRERQLQRNTTPAPEQLLELAVSLTKVADADQVLEHEKNSKAMFAKARKVLKQLKREEKELTGREAALFESLSSFLL